MINNTSKFNSLRHEFQKFIYEGFSYTLINNSLSIIFDFYVDNKIEFHPQIEFQIESYYHFEKIEKSNLENLIFNIGMIELISYWKSMAPSKVIIKNYKLTDKQISFWKKIYFHGLGEYFYLNGILPNYDDFLNIYSVGHKNLRSFDVETDDSAIIPVGGGKDSIVTMELLKKFSKNNLALILNPRGASIFTAEVGGFTNRILKINRTLDPKLLKLNAEGYLNGHTPFSALLAFVAILAAAATGKKYVALSNEGSANEPTIIGTKINHQYSKSIEFEKDFREYIHENITSDIKYFSLLRPLSEFQIASIFAKNPKYFKSFKSCNVGSKTDSWCGKCPKCLFTFIILSPFLKPKVLEDIFGCNMLQDKSLENYFEELTGISEVKPFECIGTVDEVNAALCLAKNSYKILPYLLQKHQNYFGNDYCQKINKNSLLAKISNEHFLEEKYLQILKSELNEKN